MPISTVGPEGLSEARGSGVSGVGQVAPAGTELNRGQRGQRPGGDRR